MHDTSLALTTFAAMQGDDSSIAGRGEAGASGVASVLFVAIPAIAGRRADDGVPLTGVIGGLAAIISLSEDMALFLK